MIVLVVLAAEGAVLYTLHSLPPSYKSSVKLQVVAPGPLQVSLFGDQQTPLDQSFVVQNNFIEIIKSSAIAQQAINELGISASTDDILNKLTVSPVPNTDFVYVYLDWPDPVEGPRILSSEVRLAQEYSAMSAAKPATSSRQFISQQLETARQQLQQSEDAFAKFKSEHRVADMDQEIKNMEDIIMNLQLDRDRALSSGQATAAAVLDKSLNDRYQQLSDLIATSTQYDNLDSSVKQAQNTYNLLQEKESEAVLKENESLNVDFIQVLEDARTPATPVPPRTREIALLGAVAGLLLGSLFALALDLRGAASRTKEDAVLEGLKKGVVDVHIGASPSQSHGTAPSQSQG